MSISNTFILKFNKVNQVPQQFWDMIWIEFVDQGKDKDFKKALEEYWKKEDKTTLIVECNGFFPNDSPKLQAYRRGKSIKEKLEARTGYKIYFQVYRKRN